MEGDGHMYVVVYSRLNVARTAHVTRRGDDADGRAGVYVLEQFLEEIFYGTSYYIIC